MMSSVLLLVALSASAPISVDFRGTLGQALNEIASKGGVNLIATGELNVPAEVHLKDVTAEEALEALVKVHGLELHREGKLLIVKQASVVVPPAPPVPAAPPVPSVAVAPPALPPVPPAASSGAADPDRLEAEAEKLQERAEKLREAKEAEEERLEHATAVAMKAKSKVHAFKHGNGSNMSSTGPIVVPDGEVVDDVVSFGGSVTLGDGVIADGDVVAFGGDVVLGDGTIVDGDAVAFGGTVRKGDGALVKGEEVSFSSGGLKPMVGALPTVKSIEKEQEGSRVAAFFIFFATFFGLGFLAMMFAPNRMRNIEAEIKAEPVKSGLAGLLGLIGIGPLSVLLFITVIGIPVVFVMWLVGVFALMMGMLALANTLGARFPIARLRRTQAAVLAAGLMVMMLLSMVPVLGPLLLTGAICVSLGAIIRTRVGQRALGMPIADGPIREVGA